MLVNDEFVRFELHSVRKFVRDKARRHAVPEREAVRLDALEADERSAGSPDDFGCGKGQDHAVEQVAEQLLKRFRAFQCPGCESGLVQRIPEGVRGPFRGLSGTAGQDFPSGAAESVRALIHRALNIPVALEDFASAEAELLDVARVRRLKKRTQACRRITCQRAVTVTVLRQDDHAAGRNTLSRASPFRPASSLIFHVRSSFRVC